MNLRGKKDKPVLEGNFEVHDEPLNTKVVKSLVLLKGVISNGITSFKISLLAIEGLAMIIVGAT